MKAVRIHQFGGPEVLTYEDVPDPKPRKDQVLIRVRACSMNHLDIFVRGGLPGVNLPRELRIEPVSAGVARADYVFLAVPSARLHEIIEPLVSEPQPVGSYLHIPFGAAPCIPIVDRDTHQVTCMPLLAGFGVSN